jgi:hypothetical protein
VRILIRVWKMSRWAHLEDHLNSLSGNKAPQLEDSSFVVR